MIQGYTEEFVSRMKDYAVIGLSPAQIAERMGLSGEERQKFIRDTSDEEHPLGKEYFKSAINHLEDIDAALNMAAVRGDAKALRLEFELRHQDRVDELKRKLFDI